MAGIEYAAGTVLAPVPFSPVTVGNSPVGRPEGGAGRVPNRSNTSHDRLFQQAYFWNASCVNQGTDNNANSSILVPPDSPS